MWLTAAALAAQAALIASNISVARLSFLGRGEAPYDFPLLLGLVEACKLAISTVGAAAAAAAPPPPPTRTIRKTLGKTIRNGRLRVPDDAHAQVDTNPLWLYLIPGVFYPLANSVDFLVVGVVTPGELSLLWNLKIASTAVLYRLVLKRSLHAVQWIALGTLLVGVLLVEWAMRQGGGGPAALESQLPAITANGTVNGTAAGAGAVTDDDAVTSSQRAMALLIVLVGTVVSSFASIVTEFIFKRSRENIWRQNAKLYFFGILVFIATVVMEEWIRWTNEGGASDGLAAAGSNNMSSAAAAAAMAPSSSSSSSWSSEEGDEGAGSSALPLFNGWNGFCALLLVLKSGHGLFTSFLLKYFDVILTIHADALATVLNVVVSAMFWGLEVNLLFAFGSVLTLSSILVYHHKGQQREAVKAELSPEHELSVWSEHSAVPACDEDEDAFSDIDLESEKTTEDAAEDSVFLPK